MRHVLFTVFLIMACAPGEAADSSGDAGSQSNLAAMYADGQTIPKDPQGAVKSWQRAAEQGDAEGQYNLGLMYDKGQGVPQDFIRAYMWYHLAAEAVSGDDAMVAIKLRDRVASRMSAAQIAKALEMARHCRQSKFKECD
ncbi:MAG: sel1 repeat family protein [Nitrospirae bacterium]|jgi:TPR repeat protein|nr:sel1 repeat family protein [Nitrospirota bacterium]